MAACLRKSGHHCYRLPDFRAFSTFRLLQEMGETTQFWGGKAWPLTPPSPDGPEEYKLVILGLEF